MRRQKHAPLTNLDLLPAVRALMSQEVAGMQELAAIRQVQRFWRSRVLRRRWAVL